MRIELHFACRLADVKRELASDNEVVADAGTKTEVRINAEAKAGTKTEVKTKAEVKTKTKAEAGPGLNCWDDRE